MGTLGGRARSPERGLDSTHAQPDAGRPRDPPATAPADFALAAVPGRRPCTRHRPPAAASARSPAIAAVVLFVMPLGGTGVDDVGAARHHGRRDRPELAARADLAQPQSAGREAGGVGPGAQSADGAARWSASRPWCSCSTSRARSWPARAAPRRFLKLGVGRRIAVRGVGGRAGDGGALSRQLPDRRGDRAAHRSSRARRPCRRQASSPSA